MAGFFGFFDYNKPGRGVSKEELDKSGISLYFDIFLRRFWKFISLNLLYILASIPSIAVIWFVSTVGMTWLASINLDPAKLSAAESNGLFTLSVLLACIIMLLFGTGAPTAGMTYILRNYVNDTHAWVWSDFKDNYKNNFKQATLVFIIDMVAVCLFAISIMFYTFNMTGYMSLFLRAIVFSIFFVYTMMHMYIYPLMVTFKLSLKDIFRNSLLLTMVKLPWNLLSFAVMCAIGYMFIYLSVMSPLGMVLIFIVYFTLTTFTRMFMVNNVIKKFMLEPALANENKNNKEEIEAVFEDTAVSKKRR